MIAEVAKKLQENVQRVFVGKDEAIKLALVAVLCEGHVLIEDVPGIGKTTLAKALSTSLGCTFRRIQFTPDLLPTDVTGLNWFNQKEQAFQFRPGPIMSQVVLADEINRATPRTQSALLEAMQERQLTVDGVTRQLERPFLVLATQNPIELEGTFPLPEAQIDRFMLRIVLGYPSENEENQILERFRQGDPLADLHAVTSPEELLELQKLRSEIRVEESVRGYIVRVGRETRAHAEIALGASPRATLESCECRLFLPLFLPASISIPSCRSSVFLNSRSCFWTPVFRAPRRTIQTRPTKISIHQPNRMAL